MPTSMRRSATRRAVAPSKRAAVDQCAAALLPSRARLRYDQEPAAGSPIGTGGLAGACRYLMSKGYPDPLLAHFLGVWRKRMGVEPTIEGISPDHWI